MDRRNVMLVGILAAGLCGRADTGPDENEVIVITQPERPVHEIAEIYAEMPPLEYRPPDDRWVNLPRTAAILRKGAGELRIVMLGDSIVNDTSRSSWDHLMRKHYPRCTITKVTSVRGATGCWWFKAAGMVERYVLEHKPDLLIIGGVSQRDDFESIKDVIGQVRAARECDVLLMTQAFGFVDPHDDAQWSPGFDPDGGTYRARMMRLAKEQNAAFLDMTAYWGEYVRRSGKNIEWFKRDPVHANARGEQILGRVLAGFLAPPVPEQRDGTPGVSGE